MFEEKLEDWSRQIVPIAKWWRNKYRVRNNLRAQVAGSNRCDDCTQAVPEHEYRGVALKALSSYSSFGLVEQICDALCLEVRSCHRTEFVVESGLQRCPDIAPNTIAVKKHGAIGQHPLSIPADYGRDIVRYCWGAP